MNGIKNKKRFVYCNKKLLLRLSVVCACVRSHLLTQTVEPVGNIDFPIWMFASIYFHSCFEVWTWEQIKEQKSKEKFIPPEAIDKEEDEGL